jgi:uncharacterized membrane protein
MSESTRPPMAPTLEAAIDRVERAQELDGAAGALQRVVRKVFPSDGPLTDLLRGGPLGHPAHPAMVLVPVGAWTSATMLEVLGQGKAACRLTAIGCVSALPAAMAGAVDYLELDGPRRRVATVHALVNDVALTCYTMSWLAKRKGRRVRGFAYSLLGAGCVGAGGWLGGHLAYSQGVGVETADFERRHAGGAFANSSEQRAPSYA